MNIFKNEDITVTNVNHLPIIKAYAEIIGLVETINCLVDSQMEIKPGLIVLAMVIDTLSGRTPLYRLNEFYEDKDIELILGQSVPFQKFSDHNLGRAMDEIYETGTQKIFSELVYKVLKLYNISPNIIHFDTTSCSVYGNYNFENPPFKITEGYSKDKRPDLKQFIISMLCVGGNIPILGQIHDGNASDKTINNKILTNISEYMSKHGLEDDACIYIADSALVTEENLKLMNDVRKFLTRLPATYNECGRVIREAVMSDQWTDIGVLNQTGTTTNRPPAYYRTYESRVVLYGKEYRVVVVHSSSHDKRRRKRINRLLEQERKQLEILCKKVTARPFHCRKDAEVEVQLLLKTPCNYHQLNVDIDEVPKYGPGRPANGKPKIPKRIEYVLKPSVKEDPDKVETLRMEVGCFVLLTGLDTQEEMEMYPARKLLILYKEQDGIEKNFGFLKDPVIVNSIFLKNPHRIEVLGLILLISLLIWRLMERTMREYAQTPGQSLPGWDNKKTTRPTSFMMTTKFQNVMVVKVGNNRQLLHPLKPTQLRYLAALSLDPSIFTET